YFAHFSQLIVILKPFFIYATKQIKKTRLKSFLKGLPNSFFRQKRFFWNFSLRRPTLKMQFRSFNSIRKPVRP
ncbi:MAG: hypothetical protein IKK39_00040, partial [Thermoguttaceae bacterium]|nr:hypothetical protein [Thermoguttaceae bacterium]